MSNLESFGISLYLTGMLAFIIPFVAGRWGRKGFSGILSIACLMVGSPFILHYWRSILLLYSDGGSDVSRGFAVATLSLLTITVTTTILGILMGAYVRICWPPRDPVCTRDL